MIVETTDRLESCLGHRKRACESASRAIDAVLRCRSRLWLGVANVAKVAKVAVCRIRNAVPGGMRVWKRRQVALRGVAPVKTGFAGRWIPRLSSAGGPYPGPQPKEWGPAGHGRAGPGTPRLQLVNIGRRCSRRWRMTSQSPFFYAGD